jgi:hypothetical protein
MSLRASAILSAIAVTVALTGACANGNTGKSSAGNAGNAGTGADTTTSTMGGGGTAGTGSGGDTTGGTGTTGTTTTTMPSGCQTNADCDKDPGGPICNPMTGKCVACLPSPDPKVDCGVGQYCNKETGQCESGCTGDADCPGMGLLCDTMKKVCVGCLDDNGCPAGAICIDGQCVPGCNDQHACSAGKTCCGQQCFDLTTDENNCGQCNKTCDQIPHALAVCKLGQCLEGQCDKNFKDCNGDPKDGCETNVLIDGDCVCNAGTPDLPQGCDENLGGANCICKVQPNSSLCICYTDPGNPNCAKDNEKQSCYLGAANTLGVGACKAGTQMCKDSGQGWGPCQGQVLPQPEICGNGIDDDCNGVVDDVKDADGDGWTTCDGDCNDQNPNVNPGAFEITYSLQDNGPGNPPTIIPGGNGIDDDCDPNTPDNMDPPTCSSVEKLTSVTADDLRKAMDICQTTTINAPKAQKKWGVITSEFKLGSGATPSGTTLSAMANKQAAVLTQFGWIAPPPPAVNFCKAPQTPNNPPHKGATYAGISSGLMRYEGQTGFVPNPGGPTTNIGTATACPAAYLAAHNNNLPSSAGCNGSCPSGNTCNDSMSLKLTIRAPTNAKGFSYDFRFVSAEFPEWVCQSFNDFFLALLTSGAPMLPMDKNISFDAMKNPMSVNNGFFDVCEASGCFTCPKGVADLDCTGMENGKGGATSWLTTDAPVVGGETITLELMVFDVQDNNYDSHVLIDNFRWSPSSVTLGTHE